MTATRTITTALRASVIAGLIGATTLGVCGTAAAQPATSAPAAYASLHTGHVVGDLDDDGGSDGGGYDGGGYDTGGDDAGGYDTGAEVAEDQPAEEPAAEPSEPQEEEPPAAEPQETEPQEPEPQDEAPAEAPTEEPADEPSPEPAPEPADEPAQDPAPEPAPEPATPDAPAPDNAPAQTPAPDTAPSASPQDVDTAQRTTPVEADPAPAAAATVDQLRTEITSAMTSTTSTTWNHEVTQWNSSWVSYDAFYRPIVLNPYRSALQLVYTYDNATRIITVDPLSSVVVNVPTVGVYGFTALTRSATGALTNVTVGSFTGGGYVPAKGQQRPTKPQTPPSKDNVLVRIAYANGISRPFRVKHLADLGDDAAVHARRVLIDGATSAWGRWTTAPGGEKEFDITMTLQLPGLAEPQQAPLPGYGAVQLAAAPRRAR